MQPRSHGDGSVPWDRARYPYLFHSAGPEAPAFKAQGQIA